MYALKLEDYSTRDLAENTSPPYTLPLNDFGESNDQLADQITTLSGQINAATYRFLKLIAEFDRRQAWAGEDSPQKSAKGVSAETSSLNIQEDKLTFPQRRADAFVAIAEHYLASAETSPQNLLSLKGAERCQLIMHIRAGSNHPEGTPTDVNLDDHWLIPNTVRRLACNAGLLVVEDHMGCMSLLCC